MAVHDLKEQIVRLPEQPGVYVWSNAAGEVLYVGKARSLRDRVRSYLGAHGLSPRHDALLDEIGRLEVIVTDSVMEALALENNLIKQRMPRYNILLRDDKNYPYLQLTISEAFPRVLVARSVEKTGDFYAGPFLPAKIARRTMTLTHRLFGLRSCNEVITGQARAPVSRIRHQALHCPVRGGDLHRGAIRRRGGEHALAARGAQRRADRHASRSDGRGGGRPAYEEAAQLRDAVKTVQILRDRQQKVRRRSSGIAMCLA
jgi:excinuclease ABC subunit C